MRLLFLFLIGVLSASAADVLSEEQTIGKALLFFTGSDWCPPCKFTEEKILSDKIVKEKVTELHMAVYDFPRKNNQSTEVKLKAAEAANKYEIRAFPTFVLLRDGKELKRQVGAFQTPKEFLSWLK